MTCCNSCKNKAISIYKGFGTKWDNNDLISVSFDSEIDIDGFGAEFIIGDIVKTYTDIQDGFSINLTAQETGTLNLGPNSGTLVLVDLENNKRPFSTELPFLVKDWEDGDIELDGFNITIKGRVEESKLNIKIDTSNPEKINEETIRGYIAVHNADENAHQYIQGLISAETERAEQAEGALDESKANKAATLAGYGITDAYTKTETDSTFATKTELTNGLSGKQNTISDLNTIRANALAGKSARDVITTYGDIVTYNANQFATATQGAKADSALQAGSNISLLNNNAGYITKSVNNLENYTKTNDLASVATSGSYNDLANQPTIGNGALTIQKNGTNVATFTANSTTNQTANLIIPESAADIGALPSNTTIEDLSNQTQKNAINSGITAGNVSQIITNKNAIGDLEDLTTTVKSDLVSAINEVDSITTTNASNITTINSKIPSQATSSNQLADKNFVNSSIATNTANFIGTFNSVADLEAYTGPVTNNDYAFVIEITPDADTIYNRYKYSTAVTPARWIFEYSLNNSSFTSNQWAAINSGATTTNIGQIGTNTSSIGTLSNLSTTTKTDLVNAINEVNGVADSAIQPADLATVATTGSYEDLTHKPIIPTVNNATLTIQKNGTDVATFTANSSTNQTANITVPTQPSDISAQPLLISGSNIKTINGSSVLGSGNLTIDALPSQSGNNGKYLTTSGEYPYWATITQLPSQVDHNGKYLRTNGTEASWVALNYAVDLSFTNKTLKLINQDGLDIGNSVVIDSLPTQTGNSGKFLTTDGSDASWVNISQVPSQTGQSGKFLTTNGTTASWTTIQTVYNPTITITQGSETKGSFSLNQSTNDTIEIDPGIPAQTGNSGKFLTTDGIDASWGVPKTFNIFDHKWTDYELNDQNWLNAGTFSWQDGTVYSNAYNHLDDDYTDGTTQTETVGSYTIDYKLAPDGHKIVPASEEATVLNIYNESGVAWYYILDRTNQRFKLPRENPTRENLIQVIRAKGNTTAVGFTNGTTNFGLRSRGVSSSNGFLYTNINVYGGNVGDSDSNVQNVNAPDSGTFLGITKDSTKSGIISSITDSTSVYKGKKYLYFYIGQFSQTATEQTAGLNSELFNNKVDIDSSWGFPSSRYEDLTLGASGISYTAPANGYVVASASTGGSTGLFWIWLAGRVSIRDSNYHSSTSGTYGLRCFIPVKKGDTFTYSYGLASTVDSNTLRFIYAEGESNV